MKIIEKKGYGLALLIGLQLLGLSAYAQQTVTIIGHTTQDTKGFNRVYAYGYGKDGKTQDSTEIRNGEFRFVIPFTGPFSVGLTSQYSKKVNKGYNPFGVVIDQPGTIELNDVDLNWGIQPKTLSGIKSAEDWESYQVEDPSNAMTDKFKAMYPNLTSKTDPRYAAAVKSSDSLQKIYTPLSAKYFTDFMNAHASQYIAAIVLEYHMAGLSVDSVDLYYNRFAPEVKASLAGVGIRGYVANIRTANALIGSMLPDVQVTGANGAPVRLSDFKGKYIMVDFWASWCGPCKASFPNMKNMYSKYKSDRFDIISISIDKDKSAWVKEDAKQALPWTQAWDDKGIDKSVFGVLAIPATFLIDPSGKVIAKAEGWDESASNPILAELVKAFGDKGLTSKSK